MRRIVYLYALLFLIAIPSLLAAQNPKGQQILLPTSKSLTLPSPGVLDSLNGFAAAMAVSPDGHYAAILNDGYGTQKNQAHQSIAILDLNTNQLTDFPEDRLSEDAHQSYFVGLAFSSDGQHIYASIGSITDPTGEKPGDTGNGIAVYRFHDGKVRWDRFIKVPPQQIAAGKKVAQGVQKTDKGTVLPYPAGLAVISGTNARDKLLIANNLSDNVVLIDSASGRVLKQFDLSTHELIPSSFPYTVVASRDGRRAWCSLWNASRVAELDVEKGIVARWIPLLKPKDPVAPGSHPTAMLLSPDEKLLYVTLSNADRVAVVSTQTGKLQRFLDTTIAAEKYTGTYPSALALSADGKRLFVADASVNAIATFSTRPASSNPTGASEIPVDRASGFVPTDWYPTALATAGEDLLVATSKGQGTGPNNGPDNLQNAKRHREHPYIATLLYGSIARLNIQDAEKQLPELTRQVEESNLLHSSAAQIKFAQNSNPIHHVIYIIKENRTYDQVLGDLKPGDGDPSLTMYGADVTPNQHKLALQFGVLDNFFDSGEVSGNGHNWSTAAITSDYNEQTWQINYRSRERTYDFQGSVTDEIPLDENEPDVNEPGTGYIWDDVASHGLTYRDYGEFIYGVWCKATESKATVHEGTPAPNSSCPKNELSKGDALPPNVGQPHGSPSPWPWAVPMLKATKPTKAVLRDHFDPLFPDFNTEYPDQLRADEFLDEFEGFVRARKEGKATELPAFVLLYLPDDHTHGTAAGKPRPAASVADNDLAVGRVVEAVSHSPYWDDTAIFILEDDAQNGADHVDAHRSIALVISKYSPGSADHPFVDHHFYTTVNLIHTIEALLGLPPMNQNDGYAPLMAPLFPGAGNQPSFTADWSNRDNGLIYQMNPEKGQGAKESAQMDFTHPDAANAAMLNAILWRDRKGDQPMPAAQHKVFTDQP
ncbi:MAG: beta-propeller fold lactonase family protein [Terriglobales bacterium]